MKKKQYKKLLTIIPLACMLSTPIMIAPATTFAATTQTQAAAIDQAQFENDLRIAMSNIYIPQSDGTSKTYFANHAGDLGKVDATFSLQKINDVQATNLKEVTTLDTMNETIYRNDSNLNQTHKTPSKTISNSNTFTYSNQEGLRIGASNTFAIKGELFGAGFEESVTFSGDASYTHTSSDTYTKSETITLPSQDITAQANGTTHFIDKVQRVEFSGTMEGKGEVTGTIEATTLYMTFKNGSVNGSYNDKEARNHQKEKMSIYDVFAQSKLALPSYLELDKVNKKVLVKQPIKSMITGTLGFRATPQIEFIPNDPKKPKVTMPLSDYQNPVKRAQLIK
ncbi:ETX/MTX2 family pore-forming toxin [Bacillus toyonensis]|uniref:Uncharacterized protein n=1 Tax=Bacillus toyonensis TaxID=155322 RepID=A0A2C4R7G1_9BACI|nr:ETX/MTX2 family pore-forming toxin [Bacillus toyonensis]PHD72670.1 hypothetical protein COF40_05255 [Bacillus toyonensis]